MIAFEVRLNGKRVCIAGADDLMVLTANVAAVGQLGRKTAPVRPNDGYHINYSVGGLTSRGDPDKDVHAWWKSAASLKVGDVIEIKILKTEKVDRAKSRVKANKK